MTKLYYVRAGNSEGINLDLLVRAESPREAEAYWAEHYSLGEDDQGYELPMWVGAVPDAPVQGAIPWHSINP